MYTRGVDDNELRQLLIDIESDRSERTQSTAKTDKFGEAICAFANDMPNHGKPGYLFVGVTDAGEPSGAAITDQLLQSLAAIRSDGNLLPAPSMNVFKRSWEGGDIAVVEVLPSELPPVRYKGVVWIRVGPRRARATDADERVLSERRAALARTWDARPCARVMLEELLLALFESYKLEAIDRDVLAENHRSQKDQLASLRLWDRRADKPTHAAVLLFGKDPLDVAPGAYIQYVHYDGVDEAADIVQQRRISGDLLTILRELSSLADELAHTRPIEADALRETTVHDYPPVALREIFLNAIVHRDYEATAPVRILQFINRIEVHNPGSLYGDIRPEDFPGATAYRNPVLAEAARNLGYVNRFGRGVPRTRQAMMRNGSSEPEFTPTERHFLVVLSRRT